MRLHSPEHPWHRALCALLCVVLLLVGGFGAITPVPGDGGCATSGACCCCADEGGPAVACACDAPATPAPPLAPVAAAPSLVDLATPPDATRFEVASVPPSPRPVARVLAARRPLASRAVHEVCCVFLC